MNLICNQVAFGSNYDNNEYQKMDVNATNRMHEFTNEGSFVNSQFSYLNNDKLQTNDLPIEIPVSIHFSHTNSMISNQASSKSPKNSSHFAFNRHHSTLQRINQPKIGAYTIEDNIGRGNFSIVKLATHTITNMKVAIKIIDKTKLDKENLQKMYREVEIMKSVYHSNIVTLYQIMETTNMLYIVMEYVPNGELFDYIRNNGKFDESVARKKFLGLLSAVEACHENGIVHRDLKAENLLLDNLRNIKLADFGFGTFCKSADDLLLTWCGSPPYAAPEIFCGEPYIGTKADIWSLGVVLYVMVCGSLPFGGNTLPELKQQVVNATFRIPFWLSTVCEDLLHQMLAKNPSKRPTIRQIRSHRWFSTERREVSKDRMSGGSSSQAVRTPCSSDDNESCLSMESHKSDENMETGEFANQHKRQPRAPSSCHLGIQGASNEQNASALNSLSNSRVHNLPTNCLVAELKKGRINEVLLHIMTINGMPRQQILNSLQRKYYDHLTATYLLLGERLRPQRRSLPQTLNTQPDRMLTLSPANHCSIGGQIMPGTRMRLVDFKRELNNEPRSNVNKNFKLEQLNTLEKQLQEVGGTHLETKTSGSHHDLAYVDTSDQYFSLRNRNSKAGNNDLSSRIELRNKNEKTISTDDLQVVNKDSLNYDMKYFEANLNRTQIPSNPSDYFPMDLSQEDSLIGQSPGPKVASKRVVLETHPQAYLSLNQNTNYLSEMNRKSPYENDSSSGQKSKVSGILETQQNEANRRASDGGGVLSPVDPRSALLCRSLRQADRAGGILMLGPNQKEPENKKDLECDDTAPINIFHPFTYTNNNPQTNNSTITFTPYRNDSQHYKNSAVKCPFLVTSASGHCSISMSSSRFQSKFTGTSPTKNEFFKQTSAGSPKNVNRYSCGGRLIQDSNEFRDFENVSFDSARVDNFSHPHYGQLSSPKRISAIIENFPNNPPIHLIRNSSATTSGEMTVNSSPIRNYPMTIAVDSNPNNVVMVKRKHGTANRPFIGMKPAISALEIGPVVIPNAGGFVANHNPNAN